MTEVLRIVQEEEAVHTTEEFVVQEEVQITDTNIIDVTSKKKCGQVIHTCQSSAKIGNDRTARSLINNYDINRISKQKYQPNHINEKN